MDIEEQKEDEQWSVCCSKSSKEAIVYFSQMGVACSVLLFCFVQLASDNTDREIYVSLLSFVLGILFPNPQLNTKK